ncbi:hypothetical protein [Hymenobacter baengnokdamensis]|uniref:hypothetical protein n=1 Tax=Hymenobacter baengnokdamensis TaxID=2615203 RepID=UPI00124761D3|nr:hypothetical protein [Hymenobacter baengnokdamensis]
MDFSDLQQSWQQQSGPLPATSVPAATASLLAEAERLHRFGRRRNWLATGLLLLSLGGFVVSRLLTSGPPVLTQLWGLLLLAGTLLGFIGGMWWGTTLRQAAQPGLASQAYVQASLRVFRFRRAIFRWLAVPYVLLVGVGGLLLYWPRFHVHELADSWKIALWLAVFGGIGLVCRHFGLRRYEREFGPAEQELHHWATAWLEEGATR